MICTQCRHESPAGSKFCEECGSHFSVSCPGCRATISASARFCNECGQPQAGEAQKRSPSDYTPKHLAEKILQSKSALEGAE